MRRAVCSRVSRCTPKHANRVRTELPDVHDVVLVLQNSGLVVVDVEIVGRAEDGHDAGKAGRARLPIHAIAGVLGFVCTDDREQIVLLEEGAGGRVGEEVGASSHVVVDEILRRLLLAEIFQRVGPQDVAHQPMRRRLAEAVNLFPSISISIRDTCLGRSAARPTLLRSSRVCSSGLRPPWMHKNCLFMTAANGSAQNDCVQASYTFSEYLCLHSSLKVK